MNNEEQRKKLAINEKISNVILLFLLLSRLSDPYLPTWIFGVNVPNWYAHWYIGIAYILTVAIMLLNRHRLASLNIDRPFVVILMIGGFLYLFHLIPDIGIFVGITAAFVYWAYRENHLVLKSTIKYPSGTILLILISVLLTLLPVVLFSLKIERTLNFKAIFASVFDAQLGAIVFEEVIFRGALWAYLCQLGWRESTIFFLQAFLFWMAHSKYLFDGNIYSFWVAVPSVSLLFGFMAWRSKSLTPGTIAHFLCNFATALIRQIF